MSRTSALVSPARSGADHASRQRRGQNRLASRALLGLLAMVVVIAPAHARDTDCAIASNSVFLDPVGSDQAGTFGQAVAVDGDWIAVAAPGSAAAAGRVELFQRVGGAWIHHSIITPLDSAVDDRFGQALSLRGDMLLVGASKANGAAPTSGAAYVFRLDMDQWVQESKLVADDGQPLDAFGRDVDLDGDVAVIGADQNDSLGANAGAAYVFERSSRVWSRQQKLTAPDGEAGDQFGWSVQVDDGTIAVSAPSDDIDGITDRGSVRLFERVEGQWMQSAQLSPGASNTRRFGRQLQLRNDTLLASINKDFGGPWGAAVVYERHDGQWGLPRFVTTPFGQSPIAPHTVALAPDGASAVSGSDAYGGMLAMIWRDGSLWTSEQVVTAPAPLPGVAFIPVAFDGETMVGGKHNAMVDGVSVGRAFAAGVPPRDRDHDGLDDACELATGLAEDCDLDGIIDDAQLPFRFMADSAPADESWEIGQFTETMILNRFVTTADGQAVRSLSWFRPTSALSPIACAMAVVYSDPDGDGAPFDATLLRAQTVVLPGNEPEWVTVPIDEVKLGPKGTSFFVGLYFPTPSAPFASSEYQYPHRQTSWFVATGDPIDIENPGKSEPRSWEMVVATPPTSSVILLRAELSDCDDSGRLDSCEIADGTLVDADGDGVPDGCPSLAVDLDGDGVPDTCLTPDFDLNGDGGVNGSDVGLLIAQWGACPAPPQACSADFNADGVVDGADLGLLLGAWTG
ncbi:MAG: dockerin type I domain-containing protein [Phycisphaerales bacterium]